jgi:predicted DCC family thiol-disulfide oxidoreductase YuxK
MNIPSKKMLTCDVVLYDDTCGFCRKWVRFWSDTLHQNGFMIAPLKSSWVIDRLRLSSDELNRDIRLLLRSGEHVLGADVYRYVMKRIWWSYPVYLLSVMPGVRGIFDWSYRSFADNRHAISDKCKIG